MYAVNIPVAYTNPGHGPNPFQQPESMGKRRQASPAPFERDANDIFFLRGGRAAFLFARGGSARTRLAAAEGL